MSTGKIKLLTLGLCAVFGVAVVLRVGHAQRRPPRPFSPRIPRTWDVDALASLNVPLADRSRTPVYVTPDYYYSIPVLKIYKSYPVYAPDKEPPGYLAWLQQQEPEEVVLDFSKLSTERDWVKTGEAIFSAPTFVSETWAGANVRDPRMWKQTGMTVARDGTIPFIRYVVRKKGTVEVGDGGCVLCHSRVMPDGSVIKGAQGNVPSGLLTAFVGHQQAAGAADPAAFLKAVRESVGRAQAVPWAKSDPAQRVGQMSVEEILAAYAAMPGGVSNRLHSNLFSPPQVPDLIGVKDRRFLDHTGFVRHRDIGDLMRYVALVQGVDIFNRFGDFMVTDSLPDPSTQQRYSDEQLYALALYLYSLKPPPNPHKFDALAARGRRVFERERCDSCHTPPLYTNNKLTPAEGFTSPAEDYQKFHVMPFSVGTDPTSALGSRKGTGYYKVPSLKGLWYRGPFEHNGSVATLEDWFDPRRLEEGYVPTGFVGAGVKTRPVKGHRFGLDLSAPDRRALIAFLKTL